MTTHPRADIAVIGGSGFYSFFDDNAETVTLDTPYGPTSGPITIGDVDRRSVAFLPRHGAQHEYSPHTLPYRANMWALRMLGVQRVFAPCAVGSLDPRYGPGTILVPDQLVDRTSGREQSYFSGGGVHVEFADPYCSDLRAAALQHGVVDGGTMVVVEGPRFSTRAESQYYARQGWTLVNMTGQPEAVLARELELCYTPIALVTDLDAGIEAGQGVRAVDVFAEFKKNIGPLKTLVRDAISASLMGPCDSCRVHEGVELPIELP